MQDNGGIGGRVKLFGLAAVKAGVCFGAALPNIVRASRFWYWILRGTLHVGVGVRVLSGLPPNQYLVSPASATSAISVV